MTIIDSPGREPAIVMTTNAIREIGETRSAGTQGRRERSCTDASRSLPAGPEVSVRRSARAWPAKGRQ
jgi:hypothetical protein